MRALPVVIILGLLLPFTAAAQGILGVDASPEGPRLDRVAITGNHRVEEEAIRVQIRSQPGTHLNEQTVDSDVRALYRMGFFDNVEAQLNEENGKWVLTYKVTERPLIHEVHIEGNKKLTREDLEAAFKVRPNTIFEPDKVRSGIDEAKKQYEKKGYLDATITYETKPVGEDEVVLTYTIDEGQIVRISDLVLEGARAFTPRELRNIMQTKESWIFSFITNAGNLDNEVLKTDVERLTAFYYDHGYIDVKIDEPVVEREKDGLKVTIKIDEGEQFKVGKVDISGDLLPDMTKARAKLSLASGEVFRTSKLRDDINSLTEIYGDQGYAFVNVTPDTAVDQADKTVDVTYKVSKGPEVTIDKIDITGNTKTRDKVIRRELRIQEQQRFSGSGLRKSQERLRRLGYFEDVNITTRKADREDRLDLLVDVKEASTGQFSAGAGISSGENFLFNVRLSEINLFGRGQRLILNVDFGQLRQNFSVDFTEPYFLDTELTLGVSLFRSKFFFDQFTRGGTGAAVRFLYPFAALGLSDIAGYSLEDTRIGLEYRIDQADINDVDTTAPTIIQTEQGKSLTSSLTPRLFRDTRSHPFDPISGSLQDVSFQWAGLGGQSKFIKLEARGRWYYPIYKSPAWGTFVFAFGSNLGYGFGYGGERDLPLFERYFPGGINSVRGYKILEMGPKNLVINQLGQGVSRDPIGGSSQLIFNNEIIFPIVESLGLKGVVFVDAGNAFSASAPLDMNEMRVTTGGGIRWLSPIGPLRIEYGIPINRHVGDDLQAVMFSFGGPP
jgi:outer membrane protein insertion porin family